MVDRVYIKELPRSREALQELKVEFSKLDSPKTDWVKLRIDPLLSYVSSLERVLYSKEFSSELSHLRKGVTLFHSDLVYLRENIRGLRLILESEERSPKR